MGRLVPAGTGFEYYRRVKIDADPPPPTPVEEFVPEMEFLESEEALR